MNKIQIRFDGPPEAEGGRFIEVEDDSGKSFSLGTWKQEDKHWLLVFDDPRRITELEKQLAASQAQCERLREANRWVPVTERLPDEDDWYLITDVYGEQYYTIYLTELKIFNDRPNAVAWKEKPEPYKEAE